MNPIGRLKKERFIASWRKRGCSRRLANSWYKKVLIDEASVSAENRKDMEWAHERGFLYESIEKYDLKRNSDRVISDLDYLFLQPFNNSFSKWIGDLVTIEHILARYSMFLPRLYFNIIRREHENIFLPSDTLNRSFGEGYDAFVELLEKRGKLVVRPTAPSRRRCSYLVEHVGGDQFALKSDPIGSEWFRIFGYHYDRMALLSAEDESPLYTKSDLHELFSKFEYGHVICDYFEQASGFSGVVKLYVANERLAKTEILDAYVLDREQDSGLVYAPISAEGVCDGRSVPHWSDMVEAVKGMASYISEIEFFTVYLLPTKDSFVVYSFSANPTLPLVEHSQELNEYLMNRAKKKHELFEVDASYDWHTIKTRHENRLIRKLCRSGVRPYMQKLWFDAVKSDFHNTKSTTLRQKLWCWRRGFQSFRIEQYHLTEETYRTYISDYQYHWLNRINNRFQIWVNDKTTTRYVLEPYKHLLAEYYYIIIKMEGETCLKTLQDAPDGMGATFADLFSLLQAKGLLALKPSSGTHGDGFYRLEYAGCRYLVNGEEKSEADIEEMIRGFNSYYIVTEYLFLHEELRRIYPHSVNTIRVAVVNQSGFEPKIMQTYMRIGSSSTGFTDNVGYGGICAKVDIDTGEYYCPERIVEHVFVPCPVHPDTGVRIKGIVPNWSYMCEEVKSVCSFMPELEYLGFDIAITDDGFKILEINIHQDLHKVYEHSDEFREYFRDKMRLKAEAYHLDTW
ncbi:sugar-transfer associated ATP-grasp domain-containing protein [Eggerthella sinensis]|uniref:sugar-transfer associated ATP-grasp domain-containing protein n=1 Tax=Eggerthella sinensis TaxID=242230 RepID=UPI001D066088|nr:sugar-transfer associated ATP-grasp domain-containing protein [Eggerthella sinensis]MCB7038013.1 hypothetical protein [Eggerthella sinensis]